MHRTRLTTLVGATAAAALLTLTAACGSSDSGSSDGGSGSGDSSSSSSDSGDEAAADLTKSDIFTTLTDAQKEAGSYAFTLSFGSAGVTQSGSGEADLSTDPPAVRATLGEGAQGIETLSVDGIYYLKASFLGTDKWVKLDPKSAQGKAIVGQLGNSDPASTLKAFGDAATVKKGGSKTIDGTETTQYDVTVPGSAIAKNAGMAADAAKLLPETITYNVFVDGDDLMRRLATEFEVSGTKTMTQIDFTKYGEDVSVEAPPAGETTTDFKFPGQQ